MKKAGLALLAVAAIGATAAAITWAAAGDSAVIHACVAKGSDLVRIPADGSCRSAPYKAEPSSPGRCPAGYCQPENRRPGKLPRRQSYSSHPLAVPAWR